MKRVEKIFDIYMIIFFGLVLITNIYFIRVAKVNILYLIPASIVFIILYLIIEKFNTKYFGAFLFLFAFLSKLLMIFIIKTPPISDFKVMFDAAKLFSIGDYSFKEWQYFTSWEYQSTFAVYQGLIFKIFGPNIMVLKVINCLFIALTTLLVYKIGKILFGDFAGKVAGLIHAIYIPLFFFAPVLTNQHIATLFYYLTIYLIVKKDDNIYKKWILAGVCLALGNALRPVGIVFILGICVFSLFDITRNHFKKDAIFKSMKKLAICLVSYFIIFYSISSIFTMTGITHSGLKNNNPYWKFVTGLNEKTSGRFSYDDAQMLYENELGDELFQKEKDIIMQRLTIPPYRMGKLLFNKVRYMWGDYEAGVFTFPHLLDKGITKFGYSFDSIFKQVQEFEKMIYLIIICFVIYGLIKYINDKNQNIYVKLLYYIVTIYTGLHFVIEVSFRYKYVMMGFVFLLAGKGADLLALRIKRIRQKA